VESDTLREEEMPAPFEKIDELSASSDNQYTLALAISIRVRKLRSGAPPLIENANPKHRPFETAMKEIGEGKILYRAEEPLPKNTRKN